MRTINTTAGPVLVEADFGRPEHVVNTSRVVEEDLTYEDAEPEVVQVLNARGWAATFEDGHHEELLFWCVLDDETIHGVLLGEDGRIDLTGGNVEKRRGFSRYTNINDRSK